MDIRVYYFEEGKIVSEYDISEDLPDVIMKSVLEMMEEYEDMTRVTIESENTITVYERKNNGTKG